MAVVIDNTAKVPQFALAPNKSCGTCSMCCKVYPIPELKKPANVWCNHFKAGQGCGIYAERPGRCQTYHCLWRYDHHSGDEWRPDVAKFLMNKQSDEHPFVIIVDPKHPEAWKREPYYSSLRKAAEAMLQRGQLTMVYVGEKAYVLVAQGELPIPPDMRHRRVTLDRHADAKGVHYRLRFGEKVDDEDKANFAA